LLSVDIRKPPLERQYFKTAELFAAPFNKYR